MMREQTMSSNDPTSNTEMSPKTKREREREKEKMIELKSRTEVHVYGMCVLLDDLFYWSRHIYAWARTKHFGCHSVCQNGKSLSYLISF